MKNRKIQIAIRKIVFAVIVFMMSFVISGTVQAKTLVIDENSTYVDLDGVKRKHLVIKKNKWIGFQGGAYLRHLYGDESDFKIIVPSGVVSMGCIDETIVDCESDYDSKEMDEKFDFCLPTEVVLPKTCKTIHHMDPMDYSHEDWTDSAYDSYNSDISYLEQINLQYVKYIDEEAFRGASLGKRANGVLDLSKTNVKEIGYYSFAENDDLKTLIIGDKLKHITDYSFSSCNHLTYVKIKYGVKSIGESAFEKGYYTINCVDPTPDYKITVEIPSTVTKMADGVLESDYGNKNHYSVPNPKAKVITPKGSYAYKWAKKNKIKVSAMSVKAPSNVSKLKAAEQTATSVKLTYKAGKNAQIYEIYQKKGNVYKKIATTDKTAVTIKNLEAGTVYKFKVVSVNETKSSVGKTISAATQPKTPGINKIAVKKKKVTLTWKKVKGATGYEISRSSDGKNYKVIKRISKLSYTSGKMKKGTYYYKIKAYIKIGGGKIYSKESKVKAVSVL